MKSERQAMLLGRMAAGERLILTYQGGSFLLLGIDGEPTAHFYHSEIAPLYGNQIECDGGGLVGTPPGGYYGYRLKK